MFRRRRQSRDNDIERELQAHLELEREELQERGVTPDEARYAAQRAFGNFVSTKEEVRRMWGWTTWEIFTQEIRYAFRNIRRSPGFAATVVLTLALGIGASTAVFSIVDSVLLKPLSYRNSTELVAAWEHVHFLGDAPLGPNPRHVDVWRSRSTAFSGLTVVRHSQMGLTIGAGRPALTGGVLCLPNLVDVLQVQPILGRTFREQDGDRGKQNVAVLTYNSWHRLFNGDRDVIGRSIRIDETTVEVIGVLPPDFHFPNANALRASPVRQPGTGVPEPAVFLPVVMNYPEMEWNGNYANWITLGRLKPAVRPQQAEAQLNTISRQLAQDALQIRPENAAAALRVTLMPMQEAVVGASSATLWFLMAAVLGLMLIACLNLANSQLGRSLARGRDAALRTALGAAKWRLIWNNLAGNLTLAAIGGTAGLLLAMLALNAVRSYSLDLPRLSELRVNGTVLLFAVALTITSSILSGLLPAIKLLRTDPQSFLQQGTSRAFGSKPGTRLHTWLIGLQVFGGTILLLITGVFSMSLLHLLHQEKGFETHDIALAEVRLPFQAYSAPETRIRFVDTVLQNLRELPGVQSAGLVSAMPLAGESWIEPLRRAGRPDLDGVLVNARWVSPGYFETTGQRLLSGRFFEERDRNLETTVLSEGAAKALWGTSDPVGSQVSVLGRTHTVIGVVADSHITSLKTPATRLAYVHYSYRPPITTSFVVRGRTDAQALLTGLRQAIWSSASNVTISQLKTLDTHMADSVARERLQAGVLLSFGAAALFLAMLGIYGVLSYSVTARRQEIGVRMALGATKRRVYALTMAHAGTPVCFGVITGLTASVFVGKVIQRFLYGVQAVDPTVMLLVTGILFLAAAAAAFLPARRAASVDPMDALRAE